MAINVKGSNNAISPVPGHEAHVSFRKPRLTDSLYDAYNKSQVRALSDISNRFKTDFGPSRIVLFCDVCDL